MNLTLAGKNVEIRLTKAAQRALEGRPAPLVVEMELLFACMVRKRVRFGEILTQDALPASDRLSVRFRPVLAKACQVADGTGSPGHGLIPVADPRPYVPHWLAIDYRKGCWQGEFGY